MFAKTKCLTVLSRTGRYVQTRSIRKNNQLQYSASPVEGLSSKLQVKRNQSQQHNLASDEAIDLDVLERYSHREPHLKVEYADAAVVSKKRQLESILRKSEELLGCQFYKSRTNPIGVDISAHPDHQKYFNLLPDWFQKESSLINTRIPALLGSNHPILRLKQNVDPDAKEHSLSLLSNNVQWRALIIMLIAKAFGHQKNVSQENKILAEARQTTLSEIAEMMHFAFSLHRTVVEINRSSNTAMEEKESSLHLGNKIAVLFGDLLLARTSKGLSSIKNATVTELMSDAISDFSESEILRRRYLDFFKPIVSSPSDVFRELTGHKDGLSNQIEVPSFESWKKRVDLDLASLLGRSCLCSTIISQHDEGANSLAFSIGRHIGFLMQAYNDMELFVRSKNVGQALFDISTLPLVFHLNDDSVDRIHKPTDISEIYRDVMTSPVALLQTKNALKQLKDESLLLLSKLPRSTPAPQILEDFVSSLS